MIDEPQDPHFDQAEYRRRQRTRANIMAIILAVLAVLFFLITIAKMKMAS